MSTAFVQEISSIRRSVTLIWGISEVYIIVRSSDWLTRCLSQMYRVVLLDNFKKLTTYSVALECNGLHGTHNLNFGDLLRGCVAVIWNYFGLG